MTSPSTRRSMNPHAEPRESPTRTMRRQKQLPCTLALEFAFPLLLNLRRGRPDWLMAKRCPRDAVNGSSYRTQDLHAQCLLPGEYVSRGYRFCMAMSTVRKVRWLGEQVTANWR